MWGPCTSWENRCFPHSHLESAWTGPWKSFTGLCPDNTREDALPPCSAVWVATLAQTKHFFLLETKPAVECQVGSKRTGAWGRLQTWCPDPCQGAKPLLWAMEPWARPCSLHLGAALAAHSPTALSSGLGAAGLPSHFLSPPTPAPRADSLETCPCPLPCPHSPPHCHQRGLPESADQGEPCLIFPWSGVPGCPQRRPCRLCAQGPLLWCPPPPSWRLRTSLSL